VAEGVRGGVVERVMEGVRGGVGFWVTLSNTIVHLTYLLYNSLQTTKDT